MTHVVDCYVVCVMPQVQATLMTKKREKLYTAMFLQRGLSLS
jgi:hypothetical protein